MNKILNPSFIIVFMLALLSYKLIDYRIFTKSNLSHRMEIYSDITSKRMIHPSDTYVISSGAGIILQKAAKFFFRDSISSHLYAHSIIIFLIFFLLYFSFYSYLRIFFDYKISITGTMLAGVIITLGLGEVFPEGKLLNFLIYISGFIFMFRSKDYLIPLLTGLAAINDGQPFFLLLIFIVFKHTIKKLNTKKSFLVILFSLTVIVLSYFIIKFIFSYSIFTFHNYLSDNVSNPGLVFQFLIAVVFVFLFLSIKAFHFTSDFFKFGLVLMCIYLIFSFVFILISGTGSILPVYLIFIPMSLQTLTGKSITNPESSLQAN